MKANIRFRSECMFLLIKKYIYYIFKFCKLSLSPPFLTPSSHVLNFMLLAELKCAFWKVAMKQFWFRDDEEFSEQKSVSLNLALGSFSFPNNVVLIHWVSTMKSESFAYWIWRYWKKKHPEDKERWLEEKILRQTTRVSTQGSTWVSGQTTAEGFRLSVLFVHPWYTSKRIYY